MARLCAHRDIENLAARPLMTGRRFADCVTEDARHHLEVVILAGNARLKIPAVDAEYIKDQPLPATGEFAGSMGRQVQRQQCGRAWVDVARIRGSVKHV